MCCCEQYMRKVTLRNPIFCVYFHGWKCRTCWQAARECVQINLSACKLSGVWLRSHWHTLPAVRARSRGLQLFNLPVQEVWITLILEKTLHQLPKGLWSTWTWTDHCTARQNQTTMIKEAKWSRVPGLSCRSSEEFIGARVWEQLSWARGSTAWGGLGDRGTMQAAHGHQESRAGELGHCGSRQTFTLVILPLGQALLPRTNSTAKRTWVQGENSTASLSSPWNQGLFLLPTGQLLRGGLGSEVTGLATESSSSWLSEDPRGHSTTHQLLQHRLHSSSGTEILIPAYPAFSSPDRKALHPQLDKV